MAGSPGDEVEVARDAIIASETGKASKTKPKAKPVVNARNCVKAVKKKSKSDDFPTYRTFKAFFDYCKEDPDCQTGPSENPKGGPKLWQTQCPRRSPTTDLRNPCSWIGDCVCGAFREEAKRVWTSRVKPQFESP